MSRDILENISALLAEGKLADLREQLCDMNVVDIAQAMESLPEDELLRIFLIRREQLSCLGIIGGFQKVFVEIQSAITVYRDT